MYIGKLKERKTNEEINVRALLIIDQYIGIPVSFA